MSSDSFTLPLRPVRKKTEKPDTLALRIAQINAQRGSFRNVTEAGLREEIEALKAAGRDPNEPDEEKEGTADESEDRQEKLLRSRGEMLEFAMQAHAEATYALDFVSLILSKHNPRQAEVSLSQYLKLKAPLGSLGADVVQPSPTIDTEQSDVEAVSRGWKLQSFTAAADQLLASATRLEETVAAETRYWSGVLEVKEHGWKVCRLPREPQTLGVQFGFMEAVSTYRDRGLGALRKADGGALWLDQGIRASPPKTMRVRVQKSGKDVGLSSVPPASTESPDANGVEVHIRQARDSLFDEELFYELNREARGLLQHGVELKRNLVQFPGDHDQHVLIDLVDLGETRATVTEHSSKRHDDLADSILQSFRVLLSHAHRKNLRRRSQIPPPVTAKKPPSPEYILLRPVFAYLQHRSHFRWLTSFLGKLTKTLHSAGIDSQQRPFPFTSRPSNKPDIPAIESFVDSLLTPLESYATIPLCTPSRGLRIRVFTNMHPNGAGTQFEAMTNHPTLSHAMKSPLRLGLRNELGQFIMYLYTLDLAQYIADISKRLYPPDPSTQSDVMTMTSTATRNGAEAAAGDESEEWVDEDEHGTRDEKTVNPVVEMLGIKLTRVPRLSKSARSAQAGIQLFPWEPQFPEVGELTAFSPKKNRTRNLSIQLGEDQLAVSTHWATDADGERGKAKDGEHHVWRAGQDAKLSLEAVVEAMGKGPDNSKEAEPKAET